MVEIDFLLPRHDRETFPVYDLLAVINGNSTRAKKIDWKGIKQRQGTSGTSGASHFHWRRAD